MAQDGERAEAEALDRFQTLGLTQYEAQTLINLFRIGTGTAQDITRINNVPRTRVYEAADHLHELGFIDIQYTTPRKFTVISKETIVRMLNVRREDTITELSEWLDQIGPAQPQTEQYGVWTVTGQEAVTSRSVEFIEEAAEQIVFMTVDELLTDSLLEALGAAEDRGVDIFIGGVSNGVEDRLEATVPTAERFESLWEWDATPTGRLLITDDETALVSALVNGASNSSSIDETAIWGAGPQNSLVVILQAIFSWRLSEEAY